MKFLLMIVRYLQRRNPESFAEVLKGESEAREILIRECGARFVMDAERKDEDK